MLRDEFALLGCVLLVVQTCFALADVFRGWGNNKRNLLPWMVRLCRYTQRVDVERLAALLAAPRTGGGGGGADGSPRISADEVREILGEMRRRAGERLTLLRQEHGSLEGL